jgi:hypothetical protein
LEAGARREYNLSMLIFAKETIAKHVDMSDRMAVGKAFFDLSEKHRVEVHEALKKEVFSYFKKNSNVVEL